MREMLENSYGAMRVEMIKIEDDVEIEADTVLHGYWLVFCTMQIMIDVVLKGWYIYEDVIFGDHDIVESGDGWGWGGSR